MLAAGALLLAPLLVTEARAQTTPTVDFGAATYTATEGGAAAQVEVTLSAAPSAEVEIPLLRTNGSNTTDADYTGVPASVIFGTSDTSKTFPVTAVDDSTDEPDNSVTLSFGTLPSEVTLGTTTTTVVTLVDNDDPPTLSVNDASATEGSALAFTVTLSAASEKTVTVSVLTFLEPGDTAETGDFTAVTATTLTFSPGDTTKTFTVDTAEDTIDEDNETFSLKLASANNASITDGTGQGTINDDDDPPTLSVNDANGEEGTGIVFTVTLSAASEKPITVNYTASVEGGDTAKASDLSGLLTGALNFAPLSATTRTFTINTAEDNIDERNETFTVTLSNPNNATIDDGTGRGTINDDDIPPALSVNDANATEGSAITFTVTLSAASEKTVTVSAATALETGDTAEAGDFTAVPATTLTFSPGDTTETVSVDTTQDTTDEDNETFSLKLSNPSNATISDDTGKGTINDDDAAPTLSVNDANATEGSAVTFTVTLSAASESTVTVSVATALETGDTAETGDFTAVSATTLTFMPGDTTETVSVDTTQDTTDEDNETFSLKLSNPSNATISDATGKGTIDDDDDPPTLSVNDASATEGSALTFTVTLSAASEKTVTVRAATALETGDTAGTGDFTAVSSRTLTFSPGDTTETVSVNTTQDTTDEDNETFSLKLSNPSNATISDETGQGTITDNDDPPTLSVNDASATEGNALTFTVRLSAASGKTVTVSVATALETGDTAEAGDFTAVPATTLTFSPGDTTETVTVSTTGDGTDEDNETFSLKLSGATNATISDETGQGTINDNDDPPAASVNDASATEGNAVTFTVTLSAASEKTVTVNYATSLPSGTTAEAGDFTAVPATTLTFSPGDISKTFTVDTAEDTTDEDDETFRVTLTLPPGANATLGDATGEGTINDDDDPPTISVNDANGEEGTGIVFTVTLSAASEKQIGVIYTASVEGGDTAKASDLFGLRTGALNFAPLSATTRTFTINTAEDNIDERNETFTVTLSNPDNTTIDDGTGRGTINDDDATPIVTLSLSKASTSEDDSTAVTVTARLDRPSTDPTTVTVSFTAVSPAVSGDFTPSTNRTLSIAAEATASTGTVNVTPVDNETDAPDKEVTVSATASNGLAVHAPANLTLTITDDDPAPVVTLVLSHPTIQESSLAGTHVTTVTATQDRPSSQATTVTVSAAAVSPAVAGDFTLTANRELTIEAGSQTSTGTVTITAVDNDTDAPNKEVTVSATAANDQGIAGNPPNVVLTIADDEPAPTVTLELAQSSIDESGGTPATMVTVSQSHPSSQSTTVTLTPSPEDFTLSPSGTLTIPQGDTAGSGSVTLTAVDNDTDAPDKQLTLNATATNTQGVMQPDGIPLTIVDDDPAPTLTLALSRTSTSEDDTTAVTVSATQSHPSSEQTNITVAAAPVSPAVAGDFVLTGTVLAIPAGETATTGSASLVPVDNDTDAPDKEVTVSATAENTQGIAGDPSPLTLTIEDDEPAPTVTLQLSRNPIPEAGGTATVTAAQSHPSSEETTVTVSAVAVSPAVEADFTRVGSTLRIAAGRTDSTGTVTLSANDNDVDAADKSVTVSATAANDQGVAGDPPSQTLTITDDDERGFDLIPTQLTTRELSSKSISIALTSEPTADVTVTLAGPSGVLSLALADTQGQILGSYEAQQSLTFTPSNWSSPQLLWVLALGDADTANANTNIGITASGGDYAGHQQNYAVTVADISKPSTNVALTVDRSAIAEAAGSTQVTVTATLDGDVRSVATAVDVTIGPGTATADDFSASPATFTLTIPANSGEAERQISFTPTNDGLDEDDETVSVSGSVNGLTVTAATITIEDDDTRGVTVSRPGLTVDENGSRTYTVVLDSQPSGDVTVSLTVSGDPDVAVMPAALTFTTANWSQERTVTVSAGDDDDPVDDSATVSHTVTGADYGENNVTASSVEVTVDDDDGRGVQLSTRDLSIDEGESETYTVVLNTQPTGNVTVTPIVTGDDDVTVSQPTLTFTTLNWDQPQTVTVSAARDADPEDDRAAISHAVAGADYGANGVTAPQVLVNVTDDGVTIGRATITLAPDSVTEGGGLQRVRVTVTLDGPARTTNTFVNILVREGTASVTDYQSIPAAAVATIFANSMSGSALFDITPDNDDIDEGAGETITISGSVSDLNMDPVELTITDDDERGLRVSRSSMTVNEDSTGTYRLRLTSEPTGTVTVTPSVTGADADEVTVRPETLSFTSGNWDEDQTVTVSVARDPDADDGEATITHSAAGADYDGVTGADVDVTARDDGVESVGIRLSVSPDTVDEDGGTRTVTVTAMLDAAARATDTDVTVMVESGTAEEGTDFSDVADFTLTIPANGTQTQGTFVLSPQDDFVDEGDGETLMVNGDANGLLVRGAEITIADDDATSSTVTLTASPLAVAEDAVGAARTVTVTAALNAAARTEDTEVTISVAGVTARQGDDFEPVSNFALTIPANETSGEATFDLAPVDDSMDEPDETLRLTGRVSRLALEPSAGLELAITDNDATPTATLVLTPATIRENGGSSRVTATLSHPSSERTTITVSAQPVAPAVNDDVTLSGTTLTIPAGTTRSSSSVTLRAVDNDVQASNKSVTVSGTGENDLGVIDPAAQTLTISDDESPSTGVLLTVSPDLVREGPAGSSQRVTVTATLNGAPFANHAVVTVSVGSGTAVSGDDFPAVGDFTITIVAGAVSGSGSFDLAPVDDDVEEPNETVQVTGSVPGLTVSGATLTITDPAPAPPPRPPPPPRTTLALTVAPEQVAEDAAGADRTVTVTATLSGRRRTSDTDVTVSVSGDTATEDEDFAAVDDVTLTIAAGARSGEARFTLAPVDDAVDEPDETVVVSGRAAGIATASAVVTIADDDERGVTVAPTALMAARGESVSYEVALTSQPTAAVTLEVVSDNPDVTVEPALLKFEPAQWETAQTVTVSVADDESLQDGTTVELSHAIDGGDYGGGAVTVVPVVLTVTTARAVLTVAPERVAEDAVGDARTVVVTATLEGEPRTSDTEMTVSVSGDTATEGEDFAAVDDVTLTIAAGATSGEARFTLAPVDDAVDEPDETVAVTGRAAGFATASVTVTIADDDERGVTVAPTALMAERGGSTRYEVALTSQPTAAVTVRITSDHPNVTAEPALLTFQPAQWETPQAVTVNVADDDALADGTTVALSHAVDGGDYGGGAVTVVPVAVTVMTARAVLTVAPEQVAEGAAGADRTVTVTATLSGGPRNSDTEMTVSVSGDTATEGEDFTAVDDFALTIAAGATSGEARFTLAPVNDAVDEPDETVAVTSRAAGFATASGVVTIADDDERGVTVTPTAPMAERGGSTSYEVALTSQPTAAVTVRVTSDNPDVTVEPALLTFEPAQWESAQTVTVNVADNEALQDGTTVELSHAVDGGDYGGGAVTVAPVVVTVTTASAVLTVAPERVAEDAAGDARTVVVTATLEDELRSEDVALAVSVSGGTATEGSDFAAVDDFTLTIAAGARSGEARFTLAPVDDAVDEPDETVAVTGRATGFATASAVVTIADDDVRGVTVAPTTLLAARGGSASYEVALTSQPTAAVTVRVTSDNPHVTVEPAQLTFEPAQWETAQTVTANVADDEEVEDDASARLTHDVSGGGYGDGAVTVVPVLVTVPGWEIDGMTVAFRIPVSGEIRVPEGTPLPAGMRLTVPATLAGTTVTMRAVADDRALANPPQGYSAGDAVVDIELALGAGQTATVCLPVEGRGRVHRYDDAASPAEWVELAEPAGGSPEGLACGVTDRFSLFAVVRSPHERAATSWLGHFGRAVAEHVVDAVRSRISAPRTEGFEGTLAGHGIAAGGGGLAAQPADPLAVQDEPDPLLLRMDEAGSGTVDGFGPQSRALTGREIAAGSAFALTADADDGESVAVWGRGARSSFGGREGDAAVVGDVTTAMLGADWAAGRTIAGFTWSHSEGDGTLRRQGQVDRIESSLTGLYPYLGYQATDRLSLWGVAGLGWGELSMPDGIQTDIDMSMAAAGARHDLIRAEDKDDVGLALEFDGLYLHLGSRAVSGLEGLNAEVTRLRLGVEGSRAVEFASGAALIPRLGAALRMDDGDAGTGFGLDVGGGLVHTNPGFGVSSELSARGLLAHEEAEFEDWSVVASIQLDRDLSSERGLALSLRHSVGPQLPEGAGSFFGRTLTGLASEESADARARFDTEIGYGFMLPGGRLVGVPHARFGLSGSGRGYALGWGLAPERQEDLDLKLVLEGTRHESGDGGDAQEGVALRFLMRW